MRLTQETLIVPVGLIVLSSSSSSAAPFHSTRHIFIKQQDGGGGVEGFLSARLVCVTSQRFQEMAEGRVCAGEEGWGLKRVEKNP